MSNKVTVLGFKGSGKTTYLAGMYVRMSMGIKGFSLLARDPNQDLYLEKLWNMIENGKKPDPSDKIEEYDFHIAHKYKPVCDFSWMDYPGGILVEKDSEYYKQLEKDVENSDCLLLVVDGSLFEDENVSEDADIDSYVEYMVNKLNCDRGIHAEVKMFTYLSGENIKIPPVGIVVTKCDKIPVKFQEAVRKIICEVFDSAINTSDRVVVQMSVSLGGELQPGFMPHPFCIEQPIAFAVLTILMKYLAALQMEKNKNVDFLKEKDSGFWGLLKRKKIEEIRNYVEKMKQEIDKWSDDAYRLIDLFSEKKIIYVDGQERNLREYYKEIFRNLK